MAPGLNDFEGGKIYFEGHWKGWALKIDNFWGPEMATSHINNRYINSYFSPLVVRIFICIFLFKYPDCREGVMCNYACFSRHFFFFYREQSGDSLENEQLTG
jgi:hypothetical protein